MVDTDKRFNSVEELIDMGEYFTINRARQYGKTTMLMMIWRRMSDRYLVVPLSFEGIGSAAYASHESFAAMFARQMAENLVSLNRNDTKAEIWREFQPKSIEELSIVITKYCKEVQFPSSSPSMKSIKALTINSFLIFSVCFATNSWNGKLKE